MQTTLRKFFQTFLYQNYTYNLTFTIYDFRRRLIENFEDDRFLLLEITSIDESSICFTIKKYLRGYRGLPESHISCLKGQYSISDGNAVIKVRPNIIFFILLMVFLGYILNSIWMFAVSETSFNTLIFKLIAYSLLITIDYLLARGWPDNLKENFKDAFSL